MKIPMSVILKMIPEEGRATLLACPDCKRPIIDVSWKRSEERTTITFIRPAHPTEGARVPGEVDRGIMQINF